ncbi:small GTP-binding protein [Tritrichomonas foetus]|uniref:Small GTP-binding protein n=1 Tax=Tritrichomonas foetus TaxID=1144522 RepID=A0A1J4KZ44_9EUKA|nr:small GTP-binding protein [Tritrichomonas foetus]|eukprot:OHT14982.1 small GTP-binding protein [Tritrichomonas foetus]
MRQVTSIKLVLLGDSGVGKTSIVTQYVNGRLPENVKPTIGAAFVTKELTLNNQDIELLIWDTAGQEVYRGLAPMYYRSALIAIIVYDVTSVSSFESVSYWIKELKSNVDGSIVILVCGNKTDLADMRAIDGGTAQDCAETSGALYTETSASNGTGIDRMFQMAVSKLFTIRSSTPTNNKGVNINNQNNEKPSGCC